MHQRYHPGGGHRGVPVNIGAGRRGDENAEESLYTEIEEVERDIFGR